MHIQTSPSSSGAVAARVRNTLMAMSPVELHCVYDATRLATGAYDALHNQPRTDGRAYDWINAELDRLAAVTEEIAMIARRRWPAGQDAEEHRLGVLRDYAGAVESAEIDRELAVALLAYCEVGDRR
jgi:hypothetical protein